MGVSFYFFKKDVIIEAQGNKCYYCMRPFSNKLRCTIDHLIPISAGGSDELENLVGSCKYCNKAKGSLDEQEFLELAHNIGFDYVWSMRHLKADEGIRRRWNGQDSIETGGVPLPQT